MRKPRITRKGLKKTGVAALFVLALLATVYASAAYYVAGHIIEENGQWMWATATRGALFPLPTLPGELAHTMTIYPIDLFIYSYLIRTYLLVVIVALFWVGSVLGTWKLAHKKPTWKRKH